MLNFRFQFWHTGAAQVLTAICTVLALVLLNTESVSWWWAAPWPIMHYFLIFVGSIAAHRYFCHASRQFRMAILTQRIAAVCTSLLAIGSFAGWNGGHSPHHKYADTPNDPHNAGTIWGIFLGRYVKPEDGYSTKYLEPLISSDRWLLKVHRAGILIPLGFALMLGMIDLLARWFGFETYLLLFGYLCPLFTALTAGALHNVLSHDFGKGARDMPAMLIMPPIIGAIIIALAVWSQSAVWLNFLIPTGMLWMLTEWAHASHHEAPQNPDMAFKYRWLPDPGFWIVKLIRSNA